MKFNYSPLPTMVKVGRSEIDGHGILATEFIPKNSNIGISHVDVAKLTFIGKVNITTMQREYVEFPRGVFHNELIRTPLGGFLNHSPNPNCMLLEDKFLWNLWTTEDVYPGDELCVDYNLYRCGYKESCEEVTDED